MFFLAKDHGVKDCHKLNHYLFQTFYHSVDSGTFYHSVDSGTFTTLENSEMYSRMVKCSACICSEHFTHTMAIQSISYLTFNSNIKSTCLHDKEQRSTELLRQKINIQSIFSESWSTYFVFKFQEQNIL